MNHRFAVILVLVLAGLLTTPAWPQTGTATVSGVITDSSGAILLGSTVTVTNVQTGVTRTTQTNNDGL